MRNLSDAGTVIARKSGAVGLKRNEHGFKRPENLEW
jgi:hypothetical protein